MISDIKIERLRGIREGELKHLTPLTILVGGNGSGKSTVLEALYIAGATNPLNAIGESVLRRADIPLSHRWLLYKGGRDGYATIKCETTSSVPSTIRVEIPSLHNNRLELSFDSFYPASGKGVNHINRTPVVFRSEATKPVYETTDSLNPTQQNAVLLEPLNSAGSLSNEINLTLCKLHSKAEQTDKSTFVQDMLKRVISNFDSLQLQVDEGDLRPILHAKLKGYTVPAIFLGDGIVATIYMALEIATQQASVVLLEEPEVHQHYRTMHLTAKVLWAAVKQGIQVILTTHSLEFIDEILAARPDDASLEDLSLVQTNLRDGVLIPIRYHGEGVHFARTQVAEDLR